MANSSDILVIGGGIAGLSAAAELATHAKVTVLEAEAQIGFHSGGAINAVTKSGTNDFHGGLFWFGRNQIFNARNFFSNTRDALKRNQFGGTVGGPLEKNRMFFFFGMQETLDRRSPSDGRGLVDDGPVN